ncbi:MAG: nucleotide pyrophosphohydrolase [Candidatus Omnitrophica bacterium]|nr:nucleotide pyrophosphohydrolase [Candidatus Omnitrophota bacterium]
MKARHQLSIEELEKAVRRFIKERDWDRYHSPKNIAMSIAIEAAELAEKFQWLTTSGSKRVLKDPAQRREIEDELADITTYVLDFSSKFGIDIGRCVIRKLADNTKKYPAGLVRGKHHKYTHYKRKRCR